MAGLLEGGKLRGLAVTARNRLDVLKDVPTVAESGYPGYEALAGSGVVTTAGTPPVAINRLSEGIEQGMRDPELVKKMTQLGLQPAPMGPADFQAYMQRQYDVSSKVIDEARIRLE